jgi:NAD(P) transhydrogenase subunit alpha
MTDGGVTVIGAGELASGLPTSASQMYGRNVTSVIASLIPEAEIVIDVDDEIHQAIVVTHAGQVTNEAVRAALELAAPETTIEPVTARAS